MSGVVPPMFWFVFWVGLSVAVLSFGFFMAIIIHRANIKALEVLRTYAEKGIDPPPAVFAMLSRQLGDTEADRAGREAGKKAGGVAGSVVAACIAGGIAHWRVDAGGPQWLVYFFAAAALFFGVHAIIYLFTALTTSEK